MDIRLLEEIGLTKGEIKVYLALLELGQTTTGKIIDDAQISGGKVYIILDKLIKKGLASFIIKSKTKYFSAAKPSRILDYITEKEKLLVDRKKKIADQLPSLIPLQRTLKDYDSQLYIGFEGIKTASLEFFNALPQTGEVLVMGIDLGRDEKYNLLWKNWHHERASKGIKCRMLFSNPQTSDFFKLLSKIKGTETRILGGIAPASVGIAGEKIIITTYGDEPSSLLIAHKDIVSSFRIFFESLWKIAKKHN